MSACASASSSGAKCSFGIAITLIPAALAARIPLCESSIAAARLETADDLGGDFLGRVAEPELVVHVARPLERAHAHHVPLGVRVPAAAALAHQLRAHGVPDLLGVEQDAVEVEDDAVDHGAAE